MNRITILFFIVLFAAAAQVPAQSRRAARPAPTSGERADSSGERVNTDATSVKQMFEEAANYYRSKIREFETKKIPYSEQLRQQTQREQKQLAARYAASAARRADLTVGDVYFLGLLHWTAENLDAAAEALQKYLAAPEAVAPERAQRARSVLAVIYAKQKKLADAESVLAEYLKAEPQTAAERGRIEAEIAKAYIAAGNYERAAPRAVEAYKAAKTFMLDPASATRGTDEFLDSGMLVFESYSALGRTADADAALEEMRRTAADGGSASLYFYAVDKLITYRIETGRKPLALQTADDIIQSGAADLTGRTQQADVITRLKKREKHYRLLGEPAPELKTVDAWFPGTPRSLASLRGKIVLLDFWATWCLPCFDAFPLLTEWSQDYAAQGLIVLGITRYYGQAEGLPVDRENEIAFLKRFKIAQNLPYDFVVSKTTDDQIIYGATALPTAVLIDRKGIVRYIESGTSPTRLDDLRRMMLKLINEK